MNRVLVLLTFTIAPGLGAVLISGFFLFPDWAALDKSHQNYAKLAAANASLRDLTIAESAEMRHRLNCFAEGIGVLLGGVIVAIGIHGICTVPKD